MRMSTTAFSSLSRSSVRADVPSIVGQRKLAAAILTSVAVALNILLVAFFGGFGLFVGAASTLFPLLLIWLSSSVVRADEVQS